MMAIHIGRRQAWKWKFHFCSARMGHKGSTYTVPSQKRENSFLSLSFLNVICDIAFVNDLLSSSVNPPNIGLCTKINRIKYNKPHNKTQRSVHHHCSVSAPINKSTAKHSTPSFHYRPFTRVFRAWCEYTYRVKTFQYFLHEWTLSPTTQVDRVFHNYIEILMWNYCFFSFFRNEKRQLWLCHTDSGRDLDRHR